MNNSERRQGDNDEEWIFTLSISHSSITSLARIVVDPNIGIFDNLDDYWPLSIEYEFGGRNCKSCGNYKAKYGFYSVVTSGINRHNMCKCIFYS